MKYTNKQHTLLSKMATFNANAKQLQTDIDNLRTLLGRLKEQSRQEASAPVIISAPIVEEIQVAAAAAVVSPIVEVLTTAIAIPKYSSPNFTGLIINQQRFVRSVINIVCKNNGINMANITNPTFGGISFPKADFPNMKLLDVIRIYTTLVREGDNIYLPKENPVKGHKKTTIRTLKSIAEFNNDFAKAINEVREDKYGEGWISSVPADAPLEVSIEDVLDEFVDLTQYEILEDDPCASLDRTRFLINDETGKVSIIPKDV